MKRIFITGGASYNSVITLNEFPEAIPQTIHNCDYTETIGNTGAGKALALSQLGFSTKFQTLIGEDKYGEYVVSKLSRENLELLADFDSSGTERHLNILNANGERISIFTNPSSDHPDINYESYKLDIKEAHFVVINISNYCRNFLPIAKELNKEIWTDLHDYDGESSYHQDFIDSADYIFFSSDNLAEYKLFMEKLIYTEKKKIVVCTHGSKGADVLTSEGLWHYEPARTDFEYVNCNGAGDSFFSGFLYAYSKTRDIPTCMKYASLSGALSVNSKELVHANLTPEKIETFLELKPQ